MSPETTSRTTHDVLVSSLTTFHLGGPADELFCAQSDQELVDKVMACDKEGIHLIVLGGGSNILCADGGFRGCVIKDCRTQILRIIRTEDAVELTAPAGMVLDDLVLASLEQGLSGLEAFSGIPGSVGAFPVQNAGAYGYEAADLVTEVRVLDRLDGSVSTRPYEDFHPTYRTSDFKRSTVDADIAGGTPYYPTGRWVVLDVTFQLHESPLSAPVRYAELAKSLAIETGSRADARQVRETVLELRRSKSMVYDESDPDCHSAGSFFTNPIIDEALSEALDKDIPRYPATGGVKLSAAYLIQHAGFPKGFALGPKNRAALSSRHVLSLTNQGAASAQDIIDLAHHIQDKVQEVYGVWLEPEPVTIGFGKDPLGRR